MTNLSVRRRSRGFAMAVVAVGALALVAGCTEQSSSGAGGTTSSPAGSSGQSAAAQPQADVQVVEDYLGVKEVKAADSSLAPIRIGFVNSEQAGPAVFPEVSAAAQAAADFVNAEMGGVNGHPLELVSCPIAGAEEQGQACGQQFANDADMHVVLGGTVISGMGPLLSTLNGQKPFVGSLAITPPEFTATDAYYLYGDTTMAFAVLATYAKEELNAKTAAIVYPQIPGSEEAAATAKAGMEKLGITVTSVGYPGDRTDLLGPLTAAGAQQADVIVPLTNSPGCVLAYQAIEQLGVADKPVISSNLCAAQSVKQALGDYPQWSFAAIYNVFDTSDPAIAIMNEKINQYEGASAQLGGNEAIGFGQVITMTKILNSLDPANLSADSVRQAVKGFTGPVYLGPAEIKCGYNPQSPSLCASSVVVVSYKGNNEWDDHNRTFAAP